MGSKVGHGKASKKVLWQAKIVETGEKEKLNREEKGALLCLVQISCILEKIAFSLNILCFWLAHLRLYGKAVVLCDPMTVLRSNHKDNQSFWQEGGINWFFRMLSPNLTIEKVWKASGLPCGPTRNRCPVHIPPIGTMGGNVLVKLHAFPPPNTEVLICVRVSTNRRS